MAEYLKKLFAKKAPDTLSSSDNSHSKFIVKPQSKTGSEMAAAASSGYPSTAYESNALGAYGGHGGHGGHGGYGSGHGIGHGSGHGHGKLDCCPIVVDPLTFSALLGFIGAATAFLNTLITMNIMARKKRSIRTAPIATEHHNNGTLSFFEWFSQGKKIPLDLSMRTSCTNNIWNWFACFWRRSNCNCP